MPRVARLVAAGIALLLISTAEADACTCRDPGPPCQAYWSSGVIFRGRAEAIRKPADRRVDPHRFVMVRFTVLEAFKGVSGAAVEVRTPTGPASCALRFTKGREYLVHADVVNGVIATSVCHRTRRIERAPDDLAYARRIAAGGDPLGRINGRVVLHSSSLWSRRHARGMGNVAVTLRRGEDFAVMVRTNRAGEFEARGLPAGIYSITAGVQGRFQTEAGSEIELKDPRGCAVVHLVLRPDGQVAGRVVDAAGLPVRGLTIDLTPGDPSGASAAHAHPLQAVTDAGGHYAFEGVPPGQFVVGINTRPGLWDAGAQAFHPGVATRAEAAPVTVAPGGSTALGDFILPDFITLTPIAGVILDRHRTPAAGARVYLRGPDEDDAILTAPVLTDAGGRFTIAAVEGEEYVLFSERPRPDDPRRLDVSESVRVVATRAASRLTLQLRPLH